jgi:outer membrane protein OmpA-like peptidoglycan-associated protein
MKIPLWLIGAVFAGYTVWAVNYWHCYKCQCCDTNPAAVAQPGSGEPKFLWNADQPVEDSLFSKWKSRLLKDGGQGDTLLITGWYRKDEKTPAGTANLGLARAAALKAMMQPELPDIRLRIAADDTADSLREGGPPMPSAAFSWIKMVLKKEDGAIIESDKDVIFLFPFNSTEKDNNPEVDAYLKKLVDKHKSSKATFVVTGHTDDVGAPERNRQLGLARAQSIANILKTNGIAAVRIQVVSKGEAEPAVKNDTENGRQQNRRVVLTVNN